MRVFAKWIMLPLALLPLAICARLVYGQTETRPSFEVASIKPNNSTSPGRRMGVPGDRFIATNETVGALIATAYGASGLVPQPLLRYQISGGPSWLDSDRFDIEAKAAGDAVRGAEGTRRKQVMLQTLLEERFKLALHHETKELPVYALVLARRDQTFGPKLRRSDVDCAALFAARRSSNPPVAVPAVLDPCSSGVSIAGVLGGGALTMKDLSFLFSKALDRAVLDRTGLTGAFSVEVEFAADGLPGLPTPPPGVERPHTDSPSLFTAVQEQLGLKLETTTAPVDVLVIDHVEKSTPD